MPVKKKSGRTGWQDAGGILLLVMGILTFLSVVSYDPGDISVLNSPSNKPPMNFIGPLGGWAAFLTFMTLGMAAYVLPFGLVTLGLISMFKRERRSWPRVVWLSVFMLGLCCLLELHGSMWESAIAKLNLSDSGGIVGLWLGSRFMEAIMGLIGATLLSFSAAVVSLVFLFDIRVLALVQQSGAGCSALYDKIMELREARRERKEQLGQEERQLSRRRKRLEDVLHEQEKVVNKPFSRAMADQEEDEKEEEAEIEEAEFEMEIEETPAPPRKKKQKPRLRKPRKEAADVPLSTPESLTEYILPSLDLLDELPPVKDREIKSDFQKSAQVLKDTLSEFGVEVDITNVERGPVVTRYELLPAPGVRVERIANLSNNIGLAMKAESVRVQAPIPGKGVVGIEVPNSTTNLVYLREMLDSDTWSGSEAGLPLVLGKDVGGRELVTDLAEMPHLLIAGATGSGKTVCMNSLLAGLLMSRSPDQLRLMLIDPKIVEFSAYNHIPHLVVPVITDAKKVSVGLRWAINEMEKRYKLFAQVGVRNIKGFNSRPVATQTDLFGETPDESVARQNQVPNRLPYIVIVVDELADLMLVAQQEVEHSVARLAQLSRAVGIHMILATQRPSVDVITGTIKANFPARIAFQVAQKTDSRTILDAIGAEKLLGKGDMLFAPPGSGKLIRAQGTMTSDHELNHIITHVKSQGTPQYETEIKEKIESKMVDLPDSEEDELLETAIEIIRQTKRASTSSLQRRLRIGYTRAARLMDLLEEKGVVGPPCGSDPREILIDLDGEIPVHEDAMEER